MSGFADLVAGHLPHLRRYARALTGDAARADDLVQDTLERAWIKFHLWQPTLGLRPWLFAIMHNVFVSQVRQQARHGHQPMDDDEDHSFAVRANQSDLLEVVDLVSCLALLPAEQREVLLLISLEDMSYTEASTILRIPLGTVTSRLARARMRLRALLDAAGTQKAGK